MKWPPFKAWTSTKSIEGFRHFVAINYGTHDEIRYVNLVSVLDGKVRIRVPWDEMNDKTKWICGWLELSREASNTKSDPRINREDLKNIDPNLSLHPSADSGLLIPTESALLREWFED